MKKKDRLDKVMVDRRIVKSREKAKALIMAGKIAVNGEVTTKAGTVIDIDSNIEISGETLPYVSRGGLKLQAALDYFKIDPSGKVIMDIGCSTGGFTDCLIKRNALRIYAIDVGYGQFDWSLRNNPKVILMEKTNIRYLEKDSIPEKIDLIVIDVSFISLTKVLPRTLIFLKEDGEVLALIKPQFELGKGLVGKGGVVRDESLRISAVNNVTLSATGAGFKSMGLFESPVHGQKGNIEYFIYLRRI